MIKLHSIINKIFIVFQKVLIPFELITLRLKYKKVKVYNQGKGGLNKYIINDDVFFKKNQITVEIKIFFYNLLSKEKEVYIYKKLRYLKKIIKYPKFSKINICYKINREGMFFRYIKNANILNFNNYSEQKIKLLVDGIQELHQNGFYYSDLSIGNILIHKDNIYLIDIESITPIRNESDKKYDYQFLLKSINNINLKNKIKTVLINEKIIKG